jgi:hypothetical protein
MSSSSVSKLSLRIMRVVGPQPSHWPLLRLEVVR